MSDTKMTPAAEVERLAARLATHLSVKDSSPGFHLSDEDFRLIISALCATSLNARLATPLVQAPAAKYAEMEPVWQEALEKCAPAAGVGDRESAEKVIEAVCGPFKRLDEKPTLDELEKILNTSLQMVSVEIAPDGIVRVSPNIQLVEAIAQALADREAAARAEVERLRSALEKIALLDEADGHGLTWEHASHAVAIATSTLGKHPSEIAAAIRARSAP